MNLLNLGTIQEVATTEVTCEITPGSAPDLVRIVKQICTDSAVIIISKLFEDGEILLNPFKEVNIIWIKLGNKDYIVKVKNNTIISIADRSTYYVNEDSGETFIDAWIRN